MSHQCPQCGASIEQDYGVTTCTKCSSVLFVDMDGNVQLNQAGYAAANQEIEIVEQAPQSAEIYSSESLPTEELFPNDPPKDLVEELQDFGNQPMSETALTYTVVVECIDHADLRDQVKKAITDPRFQWDVSEIMSKQINGRIELKKINAVKAAIVVRRLKELPVKVSWRQYAYN
jgi:hypothetical protein